VIDKNVTMFNTRRSLSA